MLKVIEISVDLSQPGTTSDHIEKAAARLPKGSTYLNSCATQSSVLVFFDVPAPAAHGPGGAVGGT